MDFDRSTIEGLIGNESGAIKALDDVSTSNVRRWHEMMDPPDTEWLEKMKNIGKRPFPYMAEARERILSEQKRARERAVSLPMMMTWARAPYWTREPKVPREPHELAMKALEDAGYALTLGLKLDEELVRPVHAGDWLNYQVKLEGVSSKEEETRLGKGYLVELLYTFSNRHGEVTSRHRYTVLKAKRLKL